MYITYDLNKKYGRSEALCLKDKELITKLLKDSIFLEAGFGDHFYEERFVGNALVYFSYVSNSCAPHGEKNGNKLYLKVTVKGKKKPALVGKLEDILHKNARVIKVEDHDWRSKK